jgi:hypothetical protein
VGGGQNSAYNYRRIIQDKKLWDKKKKIKKKEMRINEMIRIHKIASFSILYLCIILIWRTSENEKEASTHKREK